MKVFSFGCRPYDEVELFDWCCLYPNEVGRNPIEFEENFDYCAKNDIIPAFLILLVMQDTHIRGKCKKNKGSRLTATLDVSIKKYLD